MSTLANLQPHDAKAVEALIDALLGDGRLLSICDDTEGDGEWTVKKSSDRAEILEAMGSTGGDVVRVRHPEQAKPLGSFVLIYGNGEGETIADHTDNVFCNAIAKAVEQACEPAPEPVLPMMPARLTLPFGHEVIAIAKIREDEHRAGNYRAVVATPDSSVYGDFAYIGAITSEGYCFARRQGLSLREALHLLANDA